MTDGGGAEASAETEGLVRRLVRGAPAISATEGASSHVPGLPRGQLRPQPCRDSAVHGSDGDLRRRTGPAPGRRLGDPHGHREWLAVDETGAVTDADPMSP